MNNFYYQNLTSRDNSVEIQGSEARHMIASKRLKNGDGICLFNGLGLTATAEITKISNRIVTATIISRGRVDPPNPRVVLASAIPKGERINTLLDMATQLGMTDFVPLISKRSVVKSMGKKPERYLRICISACKQCGRYFVPVIHVPQSLPALLEKYRSPVSRLLIADSDGQPPHDGLFDAACQNLILLVGPEGGFSERELDLLNQQQCAAVKLADSILRIETACIAFLSQINYRQIS